MTSAGTAGSRCFLCWRHASRLSTTRSLRRSPTHAPCVSPYRMPEAGVRARMPAIGRRWRRSGRLTAGGVSLAELRDDLFAEEAEGLGFRVVAAPGHEPCAAEVDVR